tara:strand:+ start:238 stop:519 length:282 start_codon:yes stop_codon:yes gene_type:complete
MLRFLVLILLIGCTNQVETQDNLTFELDNFIIDNNLSYEQIQSLDYVYAQVSSIKELEYYIDKGYDGAYVPEELFDEAKEFVIKKDCLFQVRS